LHEVVDEGVVGVDDEHLCHPHSLPVNNVTCTPSPVIRSHA